MKKIFFTYIMAVLLSVSATVYAQDITRSLYTCLDIPVDLQYRSRDTGGLTYVTNLQLFLQKEGFLMVTPTGFFGTATLSAVKNFQIREGIPSTGYVGPLTRQRVKEKTCMSESQMSHTPTSTQSTVVSEPTLSAFVVEQEIIDTLDFFLSNYPHKALTGTHPMSNMVNGQTAYYTKWSSDSYEIYTWDNEYIYLREDHSGSPVPGSYLFSPGRWLKRSMRVGESVDMSTNKMTSYVYNANTCSSPTVTNFPYKITLEQRNTAYNLGGDLGVQDVIVIRYDYQSSTGDFERAYYSKEWGFVKWELYRNNALLQTSIFNVISPTSPIMPNIAGSCLGQQTAIPQVTPTIPTTAQEFISHLYSCVLNSNNPDSIGLNFWLKNFQSGAISVKSLYTQFFDAQSKLATPYTNDAFTKTLYRCPLFREVDSSSYTNVINGLTKGTLTRSGLVQTVLNSAEFAPIEAKLKALATSSGVVTTPAPVVTLSSSVISSKEPGSITLSWTATNNPTSCVASGGYGTTWSGVKASSGTLTVSGYPAGSYTFSLVCTNATGSGTASTLFVVDKPATPITVSLVPYRWSITDFPTTKDNSIYWTTTGNPTSCTPSGPSPWSTAVINPLSSGYQYQGVYPTTGTYTYNITCSKAGVPNAIASISVSVSGQVPVVNSVPSIPTDLNKFVSHLYACVLNNTNPDTGGFNFWLSNLQNKAITIQTIYTLFFGYQKDVVPAISNTDFASKLYQCILFRNPSSSDMTNVVNGLNNGTLTRSGLVQTVLNSSEFSTILKKLQQLK